MSFLLDGYIWAAPSENVSSNMRKLCGFTCIMFHQGICSLWKQSLVSIVVFADSEGPDQSDLGLRCPHIDEDVFTWRGPDITLYTLNNRTEKQT